MKLSPQHLALGENNKSVAENLNLAPETVSRWRSDFNFQAALNSVLAENHKATKDRLRHLSGLALTTIESLKIDDETPAKDKLSAAIKILELTNLKAGLIGATDPEKLKKQKAQDDLFASLSL